MMSNNLLNVTVIMFHSERKYLYFGLVEGKGRKNPDSIFVSFLVR